MGIKKINELCEGDILERPIVKEGQILIPAGFRLKKEYIGLLQSLETGDVFVQEETWEENKSLLDHDSFQSFVISIREILGKYIYRVNKILYPVIPMAEELISYVSDRDKSQGFLGENRGADLYEHTIMVSTLSIYLGVLLGMKDKELEDLAVGGLLHDLGLRFITTSYEQFREEDRSPLEMYELKKHTIMAYTVLDDEDWISETSKKMILSHHERLDGSGYPLKQKKMDLSCRIIQVCDSYDTMICGIECERRSVSEALEYLSREKGKLFDARVTEIFLSKVS